MKKRAIGFALVVMVALGMVLIGCDSDPKEDSKVVATKYRGTWVGQHDQTTVTLILREKTAQFDDETLSAYTEGNVLYVREHSNFNNMGTFTNDTTFDLDDLGTSIFTKQ